ncbi:MAG: carbohydrate transporter rane protein 1, family [Paenibacillaceae bacterium]|jgi:putative aldouronate transport system permease protein|nr:carbohydrate transporter rane protein 1, family [Paenibacillaceae bacterium]
MDASQQTGRVEQLPATVRQRSPMFRTVINDRFLYLMLLPGFIFFVVFKYVPMYGIVIAFKDFDIFRGIMDSEWVGLQIFREVFDSADFWNIFRNTILISLYKIIFGFPAPIMLALLLNELMSQKFKKWIQTILYLPHFISWVVLSGIMLAIMSPSTGLAGMMFELFGYEPKNIMADPTYFRSILVASDIWKEMGWSTIIYLAALTQISPDLYEAAIVDGAGKFTQIWRITLPSIRNVIIMLLILRIGGLMNAGFEQVLVMQNSAVREVSEIFDTYVFRYGIQQGNYSFATAVGLFNSVIALILITLAQWISKLFGEEGLL